MIINDEQLLKKAQQLDPEALQTLHEQYYTAVARYIQFRVSDLYLAEDLTGEVFVRVVESLKKGYSWHKAPKAWIMGITRNVVVDHYRKQKRMTEVELNEQILPIEDEDLPHELTSLQDQNQLLRQAIHYLTEEQRDVILMRFVEGIDIKGVAKAIGKKPGAVKALQYRALKSLAKIMQTSTTTSE